MISPLGTLEGDYVVMNLQTAQGLLKLATKAMIPGRKKKPANGLNTYVTEEMLKFFGMPKLFDCRAKSIDQLNKVPVLLSMLKTNSLNSI